MVLTLIFTLLLLLVLYVLFVPVSLCVDTVSNQYYVRLKGLAKASIEKHKEELFRIRLKVAFMNFYFYPLKAAASTKQKKPVKKRVKQHKKSMHVKTIVKLIRSFKIKRFFMDIDTGDCLWNAKLYPLFAFLNYRGGAFNINFQGRNQLVLFIQNRPIYIIKSFINF